MWYVKCKFFLAQVGDRPFTDIVYGNRNGFLTVLTEPLSRAEEPFIVRQVGCVCLLLYTYVTGEHFSFVYITLHLASRIA